MRTVTNPPFAYETKHLTLASSIFTIDNYNYLTLFTNRYFFDITLKSVNISSDKSMYFKKN